MPETTVVFLFIKDVIEISVSSWPEKARPIICLGLNSTGLVDLTDTPDSITLFVTVGDFDMVAGYAALLKDQIVLRLPKDWIIQTPGIYFL